MRLIQIWAPDIQATGFAEEVLRQSRAVSEASDFDDWMDFIERNAVMSRARETAPRPMRRGDIVLLADRAGGDFAGKPRPAVITPDDLFQAMDSVVVCPITSQGLVDASTLRIALPANSATGLQPPSAIMAERITSFRRMRVGRVTGRVRDNLLGFA